MTISLFNELHYVYQTLCNFRPLGYRMRMIEIKLFDRTWWPSGRFTIASSPADPHLDSLKDLETIRQASLFKWGSVLLQTRLPMLNHLQCLNWKNCFSLRTFVWVPDGDRCSLPIWDSDSAILPNAHTHTYTRKDVSISCSSCSFWT